MRLAWHKVGIRPAAHSSGSAPASHSDDDKGGGGEPWPSFPREEDPKDLAFVSAGKVRIVASAGNGRRSRRSLLLGARRCQPCHRLTCDVMLIRQELLSIPPERRSVVML
jgi:hypothetical protein